MRFEYIFLILLSILPISYKISYWQFAVRDVGGKILNSKKGREYLFHFWFFLEFPFLGFSVLPFVSAPFEILLYGMFFYFLILYNIFVIGKICRKKISFPTPDSSLFFIVLILLIKTIVVLHFPMSIYAVIGGLFVFMPLYLSVFYKLYQTKDIDQGDHSEK